MACLVNLFEQANDSVEKALVILIQRINEKGVEKKILFLTDRQFQLKTELL